MRMAVCPTRSLPPNAIAWLAALPPGKTKPHPQGTLPWSAPVQVFGRRHHERRLLLRRPASKKRQGTKSREVGLRLGSEGRPDSAEAGVAQRIQGITHWFAGEFHLARDHLERALARFQPGRDDDLAYRFGMDPGVAALANLAAASWPLGEVDRAISLIE